MNPQRRRQFDSQSIFHQIKFYAVEIAAMVVFLASLLPSVSPLAFGQWKSVDKEY